MKIKTLITVSILVLAVLAITSSCTTTPQAHEEREGVNQELFFSAVKNGNYAEIKRLIEEGAHVNAQTNEGLTALIYASEKGFPEVVRLLIDVEADVNIQNDDGNTALVYALAYGHTEVARLLIQKGADVNIQNNSGYTALMLAIGMGYTETAGLLIEAGADIHIESNDGGTALGYAVGMENTRLILLINEAALQLQKNAELFEESLYTEIRKDVSFLPGPHPGVLPEGRSVYFGEYTCAQGLAGSITIMHRSGGDLTVVKLNGSPLSERNPQPVGYFRAIGTYNPLSNRFTIVPDDWISPPTLGWIMAGSTGVYNEGTGQLAGSELIEATWTDGSPLCTTFKHSRIVKTEYSDVLEREPFKPPSTLIGIPVALPTDISIWTGKFSCQGTIFNMALELNNDQDGRLSGKFSYRKSDMSDSEVSFIMTGTHNPNTGRLSLGPDGWTNIIPPAEWRQMYFIDGHHLSSPLRLSLRIITGSGPCGDDEIVVLKPLQ